MSTIIYSHYHKELDYDIAHIDDKGIIYSDPVKEAGYSCGHIGDKGRIYSHPVSKAGYCKGHFDEDGKIYDHPTSKVGHCVGHVDANGVVYVHTNDELGYEIGHAKGPRAIAGAAAYLLLFYNKNIENDSKIVKDEENIKNEDLSSNKNNDADRARQEKRIIPKSTSSGGTGFFAFIIVALILSFVQGAIDIATNYPGMVLLVGEMIFAAMSFDKQPKPDEYNVKSDVRQKCKANAGSFAIKMCIIPVALGIYSLVKGVSNDAIGIICISLPIFSTYVVAHRAKYLSELKKAPLTTVVTSTKKSVSIKKEAPVKKETPAKKEAPVKKETPAKRETPVKKEPLVKKETSVNKDKIEVKCEKCGVLLRLPAGKGKIKVKCPKCNDEIIVNT